MALLKAPLKQPKTTALQVRQEADVKHDLDRCAEFIDANPPNVVSKAFRLLFTKNEERNRWAGQHTNNHNQEQSKGEAITKTAKQT